MKIDVRLVFIIIALLFTAWYMNSFYFEPSSFASQNAGTVLNNNWWEALNWIKENTAECSVIATYWDPGHFITGVANRMVVFDGATQNSELFLSADGTPTRVKTDDTVETRSRIQDIATAMYTTNEAEAVDILKKYTRKDCAEPMYFIASSDLIFKSQWWSYFSTWKPGTLGKRSVYSIANLAGQRPILAENVIAMDYPVGDQQSFLVFQRENETELNVIFQGGNQFVKVNRFVYPQNGRIIAKVTEDAEIDGTVLLLGDGSRLVFMPPELEDSMFTHMFFFNGETLPRFEFVKEWNGEVKLFRVVFE